MYGQSIQIVPINGFGSGLIEEVPGFCAERGMTPGVAVSASNFFLGGEAFSLDRRGWKAAPTGKMPNDLEAIDKPAEPQRRRAGHQLDSDRRGLRYSQGGWAFLVEAKRFCPFTGPVAALDARPA
jgi:hypothetical protein